MSKRILVASDLHLADGYPILDGFGLEQQAAFEELLPCCAKRRALSLP